MKKITLLIQRTTFFIQLLLLLVLTQIAYGQEKTNPYEIKTTIGSFEFKEFKDADFKKLTGGNFENNYFRLVQFYQIPTESQRKNWERQGLIINDYLSANTYYVVLNNQFSITQLKGFVRTIAPVDAHFKKEASLFFNGIPDYAKKGNNKAQLILSYYKSINPVAVQNDLKSKGVQILAHREYSNQLDVLIDVTQLDAITNLPYVQFIGAQAQDPIKETYDYRNSTSRANFLNTGYNGLNYNGAGVVISDGESGIAGNEIDFKGRLIEVGTSGTVSDHKVGCIQNAGGAGNLDPANKNNAWGATLLSLDGGPDYSGLYTSQNLRYTNHSYGYSISGGYDSSARNHDLRIAALPNHLVSYSAGNSGTDIGYAPYNFANWSNITGQVKQNKNMIAVGALSPEDQITGFSSRGPMYDGRIIPQLVVEGSEGTSYASPKVVGDFAILAQVYKDKNGGTEPTSSLLRAVIMDTADDLGNPGPDYTHGFGRPNLRRAYAILNNHQTVTSSVANGGTNNHTVVVPANTKQIRAMIVWPDVAAAVNANPAIVNNLNLTLKSPSLTTYNPWVLDSTPNATNLNAPATRGVDNINTIEQVTVDNPGAGTWTISVNGFSVPSGPQTYYVVYEFLSDELQITYPLENQKFVSGEEYYLRWDSYGDTGTFNLAYELNNSGTWVSIENGYDASSRVFKWIAPTVIGGINTIKFKVQRGALTSISSVNQLGKVPDNFRIAKVCSDVVTLKWSPIANATSYKVYRLGTKYMEEVTSNITYSGNSATLTGQSTTASEYYAVSALTNTTEGQRTVAIEKVAGDANCTGIDWTGTISTDWFTTGNWATNALPTAADNVNIVASAPFQPNISAAGAVCATITINTGASVTMSATTAYTLSVSNDWINNGTFTRGIGTVDFVNTTAYQEISGTSTTNFYFLKVTKGTQDKVLEASSIVTLNAAANPLNLTSGTFKLSSNSTITPFTSSASLSGLTGIWNNGGTINFGNFSWFLNSGLLQVSAGTTNIGTTSNNTITYLNNGLLTVEGGTLNIAGRFSPNSAISSCTVKIAEGTVVVNKFGSTSTTRAPFEMTVNANFNFIGGTLIIARASSNASDYLNLATSNVVLGGTLQIGDATTPINQTIRINSTAPTYNLTVNAFNSPKAQLITNNLTIKNDVIIAGGTFDTNALDVTLKGNWTNNGTFTPNVGKVVFDGAVNQKVSGTNATTFKGVTLNNSLGLTLNGNVNASIDGQLILTNGVITTGNNKLIITSNGSVLRTLGHVFGNLQKAFSNTSTVNTFEIGDAVIDNYTPAAVSFASITTPGNLIATTKAGDHPSIASSTLIQNKSINRYWTLQNSGITFTTYNTVFNFLSSDKDVATTTANLKSGNYTTSWSYPSIGTLNSNNTEVTGLATFGDFQLAENCVNTASTQTESACVSYTWPVNNQTYIQSGNYVSTSVSADGCTDTKTLVLTITPNATPTFTAVAPICSGGSLSALPTTSNNGITGTWSPALSTTTTTTYTFTPNLGQCATTATQSVTVNPNNTISLSSGVGTNAQTVFVTSAITPITYNTTSATGATFTGLPLGVTGSWLANGITISGLPSTSGTFNYTILLTGGCGTIQATGTITSSSLVNWYLDADGDHYYTGTAVSSSASPGTGYTTSGLLGGGDCNDSVAAINPGVTEICYNAIDDNCNTTFSEGCAPVVVNMTPSYNGTTLVSLSTAVPAVAYTYLGATNLKYRFSITNVTTNTTAADIIQSSRYVTIPGTLYSSPGVYTIKVSAVINDEVVDYSGNTITVNAPTIPKITLAQGSCNATLAALTSTLTASQGQNATGYTFRIREVGGSTYATSSSSTRFVSANSFTGFPLSYSTSYLVSVQYSYVDPATLLSADSGYGTECTITTPSIPTTTMASPTCGSTVAALNAGISATSASYATGYQFRIRLTSNVGGPYTESAVVSSRFSSLTTFGTLEYNTSYSISVRYSVVNNNVTLWSAYGQECILNTPNLPTTQLVPSQCGQIAATTLTQQLNIVSYPGFPNYRVKLTEVIGETIGASQEITIPYSYFRLNQFSTAQNGKVYNIEVAIKQGTVFGPYSTVCDVHTPAIAKTTQMPFKVTAYPNPFANNFMLDVKTTSELAVNLKVYDMVGRLIDQRDISASEIGTTTIGDRYPSGVYNVVVSQEDNIQTIRVAKR